MKAKYEFNLEVSVFTDNPLKEDEMVVTIMNALLDMDKDAQIIISPKEQ